MNGYTIPISDEKLGLMELEKDRLYDRIPVPARKFYVEASLLFGEEAAGRWAGRRIQDILEEHKIEVIMKKHHSMEKLVRLRGEICFSKEKSSITVYEDSLQSMAEVCSLLPEALSVSEERFLEIHLAHEFFHYLEFMEGKTVSEKLPGIQIWKILDWKRTAAVMQTSEIAAHAFAKKMYGLKVLPNYYDMVYIKMKSEKSNRRNE